MMKQKVFFKRSLVTQPILILGILFGATIAQANQQVVAPAPAAAPTGPAVAAAGAPASGEAQQYSNNIEQINSCTQMKENITQFCSHNVTLNNAQARAGTLAESAAMADRGDRASAESRIQTTQASAQMAASSIAEVSEVCGAATNKCRNLCNQEYSNALAVTPQNPQTVQMAQQAQQNLNFCVKEHKNTIAKATAARMSLAEVMQSLLALKELLGIGGSGDDAGLTAAAREETDGEEDVCDGEDKHLYIKCGQSGPKGTRANLKNTVAGLNGGPPGENLFNQSEMGEPGGASKSGAGNGSFGGGMGAGFGGGMMGMGSGLGSAAGSEEAATESLNADINKGFMSAGMGGGSSGGGGGGSSGSKPFAGYVPPGNDAAANQASLQKKLNQYASGAGRGLASTDGTNGPLQDIWSVVNQSYKKNSESLFHQ